MNTQIGRLAQALLLALLLSASAQVLAAPACKAGPAEGFPETNEQFEALCADEQSAYIQALYNLLRARCLRRVVDYKIDFDIAAGAIIDFGSPLKPGLCDNPIDLLQ